MGGVASTASVAKGLGTAVPPTVIARADQVIE
jgi:hypothetical protein